MGLALWASRAPSSGTCGDGASQLVTWSPPLWSGKARVDLFLAAPSKGRRTLLPWPEGGERPPWPSACGPPLHSAGRTCPDWGGGAVSCRVGLALSFGSWMVRLWRPTLQIYISVCFVVPSFVCLVACFFQCLFFFGCLVSCLVVWLFVFWFLWFLVGWLFGSLALCLFGWLVALLFGCLSPEQTWWT